MGNNDFFIPTLPSIDELVASMQQFDTGWLWPLDSVQPWFENLYNTIVNLPNVIRDKVFKVLEDFFKWVYDNIAYPLYLYLYDVLRILDEWTANIGEPWKTIIKVLAFPSAFAYKGIRDVVIPAINSATAEIVKYFDAALSPIAEAIRSVFSPIIDPIKGFIDTVVNFFTRTIPEWLDTTARFLTEYLPNTLRSIINFLTGLPDRLYRFFTETLPSWVLDRLRDVWDWINRNIIEPIKSGLQGIWDAIVAGIRGFIQSIIDYFGRARAYVERGDIAGALLELTPVFATGFSIALVLDLASIKIVGSGIDVNAIKEFITSIIDVKQFTSIFFGVLAAVSIQKPLEYVAKRIFRTELPSPSDALQMYAKNVLSYEELRDIFAAHGYSDYWFEKYEWLVWKDPSFEQVFLAFKRGIIPERDYYNWLQIINIKTEPRPGNTVPDVKIFEESMYRMPSPFVIAYAADSGVLSLDDIRKIMEWSLIHPDFVDITAKALYERAYRDDYSYIRRQILDAYSSGIFSYNEALEELLKIIPRREDAERLLAATLTRRKYIAKLVLSKLEDAYLNGYLDRDGFIRECRDAGLDIDYCEMYASALDKVRSVYYILEKTRDERNRVAYIILKDLRDGFITREEAYRALRELGFFEEEVNLKIDGALREFERELKELWMDYYREQLKEGLIDPETFYTRLLELGMNEAKARALTDYYSLRYVDIERRRETRDERKSLASTYIKKFIRGEIDEATLAAKLVELGFSDDEISYMITRAKEELDSEIKELKLKQLEEQLKQGIITVRDYISACTEIIANYDKCKEQAELLWTKYIGLDYYVLTKDERSALATIIIKKLVNGIITEDEAYRALRELGFSDREIELRIRRAREEAELAWIDAYLDALDDALKRGKIDVVTYRQLASEYIKDAKKIEERILKALKHKALIG